MPGKKINIAIAGGPCTGKSTLAANVFVTLKNTGFDYDLIQEEMRRLKREFGDPKSPFDRFYMWRQQEREEIRSNADNGFVTDMPLFHFYAQARQYQQEPRDKMAVRELFRMCLELEDRYQLIVIAENPLEIPYRRDQSRSSDQDVSVERHKMVRAFVEFAWPKKILLVNGSLEERLKEVISKLTEMHSSAL